MSNVITYPSDAVVKGGVAIIIPANGEVSLDALAKKLVPSGVSFQIVSSDKLPSDRSFRNAWLPDLSVDVDKAKDITKARLRVERDPLLKEQDVAFQIALEKGASTKGIVQEKQRLRDITDLADAATTLDELKAIIASK